MPTLKLSTFYGAALLLSSACNADIYMHNPRGSNDRNCEKNANRNNGDRLFDSQNNAAGGYACPRAVGAADNNLFETPKQMYYLEGSYIPIEWTNQHGCGPNGKLDCDIIIQYMCEDTADPTQALRDGEYVGAPRDGVPRDADDAATDRIPLDDGDDVADNVESRRYGVHETLDFYETCSRRERNKGLFAADQNLNRNDATRTRQNPNGARRGLECPEERDYFPYWAPSPWRDIAILSSRAGAEDGQEWLSPFCKYATSNSQNVKAVGYCEVPEEDDITDEQQNLYNERRWPNNEQDCLDVDAQWVERAPLGGGPPECMQPEFTRVNHLGNPLQDDSIGQRNEAYRNIYKSAEEKAALEAFPDSASASRYLWKVPEIPEGTDPAMYENCVIRVRYNVSTADYPAYEGDGDNGETTGGLPLSPSATITDEPVAGDPPPGWAAADWKVFQMTPGLNASYNGDLSPVQHDPYVALGPNAFEFVSLAVNTNQYGRTFQDRSYNFAIKPRPADIKPDVNIFNVNVRGKRGNIVQVYPSVEYDFVPNGLSLQSGREGGTASSDFVHFQWTGSDYNPRRGPNDAEGGPPDGNANQNARADRSNLVELHGMARNFPMGGIETAPTEPLLFMDKNDAADLTFFTEACCRGTDCRGRGKCPADLSKIKTMALLDQEYDLSLKGESCLSQEDLEAINNDNERETNPNNCAKINGKAHPYFDGGLQQVTASKGVFSFFSSRNNNFSNRDQTIGICVDIKGDDCEFTKGVQKKKAEQTPLPLNDTKVAGVAVGAVMAGAAFALLGMKAFQARGAAGYDLSKGGVTVPMKHTMSKTTASAWLKGSTEAV